MTKNLKTLLLTGIACVGLTMGAASAADMQRPVYKAPPPPADYNWSGFYLGTFTGVSYARTTTSNVAPFGGFDAGIPLTYEQDPMGISGGGTLGYNWQSGWLVLGAEFEAGYLGINHTERPAPDDLVSVKYGWYGAATGRVGLATDRLLNYVKGGFAFARIQNTASDLDGNGVIDPTDFSQINSTRTGWVLGTGFEYALQPNLTVKSEYLYMDFGSVRSTNTDGDFFDHQNRIQTWKIGLNYKWGMGPLVARY